jgi:hypothetical protein
MNRRNWLKALVACVVVVSGAQPVLAKPNVIFEQSVVDGALYGITADGDIDVNSLSETGYGLFTMTEKKGLGYVKASWTGQVTNASGKAFKLKNPAELGTLFVDFGSGGGVVIDRYEYSVSKSGKATLRLEAHGPLP